MGNTITYLRKMMFDEPTLYQQVLNEIDQIASRSDAGTLNGSLIEFREYIVSERLQTQAFLKELQQENLRDVLISSRCVDKLTTLKQLLESKNRLFISLNNAENFQSMLEDYLPKVFAQSYLFYVAALQTCDPTKTPWAQLQTILTSDDCYDQFINKKQECIDQLNAYRDKYQAQINLVTSVFELIDFLDEKLAEYVVNDPAPEAIGMRWVE